MLDDPRAVALGNEPVRIGSEIAGRVTSGGFGYTVGASIAYAHLPPDVEPGARVEVDMFGTWVGAEIKAGALVDPQGERVRA